jgi:glycosyltransferase involved in cell wall biosynthesis
MNIPCQEISDPAVMAKKPLVSAKMITYNHAPYIAQAIEGVIQQKTDFPFELVIGEDCSTDGTREIVFDYQKRYPDIIRVITSDKNVGACKNSIRADKACRGKYIAFCEGDDYWHDSTKLQKQIKLMESDPACVMTHSQAIRHNVVSGKRKLMRCLAKDAARGGNAYFDILTLKHHAVTSTRCVRRKELNDVIRDCPECTDESIPFRDAQVALELSRKGKVVFIPEPLATYNILPESASNMQDANKYLAFAEAARDLRFHYMHKYPCPEAIAAEIQLHWHNRIIELALKANRGDVVRSEYNKAKQKFPSISLDSRLAYWAAKTMFPWSVSKSVIYTIKLVRRVINKVRRIGGKMLMFCGRQGQQGMVR